MHKDPVCGMDVKESTGLKLVVDSKTYYFCSEHCLSKFAKETYISCAVPKTKWYKNKVVIVTSVLLVLSFSSYFVHFLGPFRKSLLMYFKTIWWAVLLGLFIGGVIEHYIPREYISKMLAVPKKRTIFYSVILGFFMSVCSHGILALSIELYKKGASVPAVVSFLLASPWANLPLTIMLIGFFGIKAFYIIISAIIIAIITGLIFQFLDRRNLIEKNKNIFVVDEKFSILKDIRKRSQEYKLGWNQLKTDFEGIISGSVSLANMVLWWILIGMALASLLAAYVPQNIFHQYMGPSIMGLFVTLLIATILEVCSEGTAPLAFEIYRQTGALGNSFVFLMAGVVTDYTEIGLLWTNIGRKTAIWLLVVTVPQVIILGILANIIF